jgi:hypothetical protein
MQVRGKKKKVPAVQRRGTKGSTKSGNGRLMIPDEILPLLEAIKACVLLLWDVLLKTNPPPITPWLKAKYVLYFVNIS